jgi:molecular chaperone GrpE (heat shock protein)
MEIRIQEYDYNLLPAADLEKEIERLNQNLQNERSLHLYTLAEFINYRRQITRNGNLYFGETKREILLPLLDILESLGNTILRPVGDGQTVKNRMQIAYKKLLLFIESQRPDPLLSPATRKILLKYNDNSS